MHGAGTSSISRKPMSLGIEAVRLLVPLAALGVRALSMRISLGMAGELWTSRASLEVGLSPSCAML